MSHSRAPDALHFVALYKLLVGLLLLVVALELLALIDADLTELAHQWILRFHADPDNPHMVALVARVGSLDAAGLEIYSVIAGLFGNLHVIEGVGLWLKKHWAEYLTVASTAALVPFELIELVRNQHLLELVVLTLNVAVVVFLVRRLQMRRAR